MTLREVIERLDTLKPNQYTAAQKVRWLSECDALIYRNIFATHDLPEGAPVSFDGYTDNDMDRQLLVGAPHDILYEYWLQAQVDYYNKELGNYNNSRVLYNSAYTTYEAWHNSNYMPLQRATHIKL